MRRQFIVVLGRVGKSLLVVDLVRGINGGGAQAHFVFLLRSAIFVLQLCIHFLDIFKRSKIALLQIFQIGLISSIQLDFVLLLDSLDGGRAQNRGSRLINDFRSRLVGYINSPVYSTELLSVVIEKDAHISFIILSLILINCLNCIVHVRMHRHIV